MMMMMMSFEFERCLVKNTPFQTVGGWCHQGQAVKSLFGKRSNIPNSNIPMDRQLPEGKKYKYLIPRK